MATIAIFVYSNAGRTRFEFEKTTKISNVRKAIADKLKLPLEEVQLKSDKNSAKAVITPKEDSKILESLVPKNSVSLQLSSKSKAEVEIQPNLLSQTTTQMNLSDIQRMLDEEKKEKNKELDKLNIMKKNSDKDNEMKDVQPKVSNCTHGPNGRCTNCIDESQAKPDDLKQVNSCKHGPNGKCPNCLDKDKIKDTKHVSFDEQILQNKNSSFPQHYRQKLDPACKNHAPQPTGICNKCMPQTIVLKRQPYRHVDQVQFMNKTEIERFVKEWLDSNQYKQKVGYLYGYQAEDPNQPYGVRAVVEAIYEPPQKNEINGF